MKRQKRLEQNGTKWNTMIPKEKKGKGSKIRVLIKVKTKQAFKNNYENGTEVALTLLKRPREPERNEKRRLWEP
jgi:hypothetical protein